MQGALLRFYVHENQRHQGPRQGPSEGPSQIRFPTNPAAACRNIA